MDDEIPLEFYREMWEDVDHPMACLSLDSRFLVLNGAFERFLGYSAAELLGRSETEVTVQRDVGGHLASVQAVIDGRLREFTMDKAYRHKTGFVIQSQVTVRRFPREQTSPLLCFRIESVPAKATRIELDEMQLEINKQIKSLHDELISQIDDSKRAISITQSQGQEMSRDNWSHGDKVGRDKTTNDTLAIKWLIIGLIAVASAMAYGFYYLATMHNHTTPEPPRIEASP